MRDLSRLKSVAQLAREVPAFTESSLRWLIFNAKENGLESAIVRIGRRVYLDMDAFDRWLDTQAESPRRTA